MIAMRPLGVVSSWTAGGALEGSGWGWLPGWHGALFPHATGYGLSAGPLSRLSLCVSCGITLLLMLAGWLMQPAPAGGMLCRSEGWVGWLRLHGDVRVGALLWSAGSGGRLSLF